jgi:hypothetical protein
MPRGRCQVDPTSSSSAAEGSTASASTRREFRLVKICKVERPRFRANVSPHQPDSNLLNSSPSTTRDGFIQAPTHLAIYPRPSTGAPQYTNTSVVGLKSSRYRPTRRILLMPWTPRCSNPDQGIKTLLFLLQPSSARPVDSKCRGKTGRETARLAYRMYWTWTLVDQRPARDRSWDPARCTDSG